MPDLCNGRHPSRAWLDFLETVEFWVRRQLKCRLRFLLLWPVVIAATALIPQDYITSTFMWTILLMVIVGALLAVLRKAIELLYRHACEEEEFYITLLGPRPVEPEYVSQKD